MIINTKTKNLFIKACVKFEKYLYTTFSFKSFMVITLANIKSQIIKEGLYFRFVQSLYFFHRFQKYISFNNTSYSS